MARIEIVLSLDARRFAPHTAHNSLGLEIALAEDARRPRSRSFDARDDERRKTSFFTATFSTNNPSLGTHTIKVVAAVTAVRAAGGAERCAAVAHAAGKLRQLRRDVRRVLGTASNDSIDLDYISVEF